MTSIYRKPIAFALVATLTILVGTIATMAYPMFRNDMHVKVPGLQPLPALALAGRDIYQREGCLGCHSQNVRPLKSEAQRYHGFPLEKPGAEYSLAGEFAYDHPFLWGSKRTGPDLAFEGWIKAEGWHRAHFTNPQAVVPGSNMPAYAFLNDAKVDAAQLQANMRALRIVGVPYTDADLQAVPAAVGGKTEMDAMVAYMVSLGRAVDRTLEFKLDLAAVNPFDDSPAVRTAGMKAFADKCAVCHGDEAEGQDGVAPSLVDGKMLGGPNLPDGAWLGVIKAGSTAVRKASGRSEPSAFGEMPAVGGVSDEEGWAIIRWLHSREQHEAAEHGETK